MAAFVEDGGYMPTDDAVSLEAGGAYLIDVLANDIGLPEGAGDKMLILVNPACGIATREEGMISYAVDPSCSGELSLTYCVPAGDVCPSATLSVTVIPAPDAGFDDGAGAVSAVDPTLTGGNATREFGAEAATPDISFGDTDMAGFTGRLPSMGGALGAVGPVGTGLPATAGGAGAPRPAATSPSAAPGAPSAVAEGPFDLDAETEADASLPSFGAIAAVTGPTETRKRRKPRSVYASPAIEGLNVERPQRPSGVAAPAAVPAGARGPEDLVTAPAERVRLAQAEAVRRSGPILPEPHDGTPSSLVVRQTPRIGEATGLAWGGLADHEGGTPIAPFLSPLAEFRELVSLSAAPLTEGSVPEPVSWTRVAALWGIETGFTHALPLSDSPAARLDPGMEPLAELIEALGPLSPPEGFYTMVSLDPHARHDRTQSGDIAPVPPASGRPAAQVEEPTEPAPDALRRLRSAIAALLGQPEGPAEPKGAPSPAAAVARAEAAAPLPFPERDATPERQLQERTEPAPGYLSGFGADLARVAGAPRDVGRPQGVAFRALPVAAPAPVFVAATVDLSPARIPALEPTEPLPPTLAGWEAGIAEQPPMRVSVNLTLSGARDMPVRARRNFQTLAGQGAQSQRLVMLDQAPRNLNKGERTEPLPLNLRRVRSFPPLLSQRVRMTPDFYGVGLPRQGFAVRRYKELAPLGAAARPFMGFEPELPVRADRPDPNPPSREEALAASLAAGLGPFVGPAPTASRVPFDAAPAARAPSWPEIGAPAPLVLAAAEPITVEAPEQKAASMTLAALSPQEPAADAVRPAATLAAGPAPDCPIQLSAFPASGGLIQVSAVSDCRAGRVAVLHLEDLRIALRFDDAGVIEASVPGVARDSRLKLVDGDAEAVQPVTLLDIGGVDRVAISWDDEVDLNLHAFEFGAGLGDAGHVWAGAAPNERAYRRGTTGLVSSFPALDGKGRSVEFYSFNRGRRSPTGRIVLAVEFASRGTEPTAPYCDGDPLASPSFRVHNFDGGVMDGGSARIFEAAPCGVTLEDASMYQRDLVQGFIVVNR
ncbi:hypothetical protein ACQ5SO_20660 [Rhodovulum sp. DZ06]|uniref:hypothetical protein n=1 Tax=Rhodovulum sp. DZ06 TaxID=3425126 RepID=UPI003D34F8AB